MEDLGRQLVDAQGRLQTETERSSKIGVEKEEAVRRVEFLSEDLNRLVVELNETKERCVAWLLYIDSTILEPFLDFTKNEAI